MVNQELKNKLIALGMTEELISAVETGMGASMETAEDWAYVSTEDLISYGVPKLVAMKVDRAFNHEDEGQKATSTANASVNLEVPGMGQMAEAMTKMADAQTASLQGDLSKQPLKALIKRFLAGEQDLEIRQHIADSLKSAIGTTVVFVQNPDGNGINLEATLELVDEKSLDLDFEIPEVYMDGIVVSLEDVLERHRPANPLTGESLAKGAHWLKVDEERRLLVAYARLTNNPVLDGLDEMSIIDELMRENLPVRWSDLNVKLNAEKRKSTPVYHQAAAALIYRKEAKLSEHQDSASEVLSDEEEKAKKYVMEIAEAQGVRHINSGMDVKVDGTNKTLIVSGGMQVKIHAIVTTACNISGGMLVSGTIYTPFIFRFTNDSGVSCKVKQEKRSWVELMRMIKDREI